MDGNYGILCNSSMDTYGYLYNNTFDPAYPTMNILAIDDDSGGYYQFMFTIVLQTLSQYILVVTTFNKNVTGPFTITAVGLASVEFSRINISSGSTTTMTTSTTTSIGWTNTTTTTAIGIINTTRTTTIGQTNSITTTTIGMTNATRTTTIGKISSSSNDDVAIEI
ncbi:unnamed protein product [Rotaria sp. Silwood2]|nr:unnamed protein product [Rotaria sp. Silwood2]CAF3397172.1 unnamed protein product [Rotaria sp. Silwood2]CAF4065146.1 unnamed protein product [Rotaria sp. Silwood2]CAF4366296.1 unnamed protein product [Rotaria sp. Silwood2]